MRFDRSYPCACGAVFIHSEVCALELESTFVTAWSLLGLRCIDRLLHVLPEDERAVACLEGAFKMAISAVAVEFSTRQGVSASWVTNELSTSRRDFQFGRWHFRQNSSPFPI